MEDVWKELSLASDDHHYSTAPAATPPGGRPTLLEFLTSPLDSHPQSKPSAEKASTVQIPQKKPPNEDYYYINPLRTEIPSSNMTSSTAAATFCACSKRKAGSSGNDNARDDQKKYRLMKNRESAARSRARKQAYTNELEQELEHLMEENSKLRKQQEQLYAASPSSSSVGDHHHQKKQKLHRTLTAPF